MVSLISSKLKTLAQRTIFRKSYRGIICKSCLTRVYYPQRTLKVPQQTWLNMTTAKIYTSSISWVISQLPGGRLIVLDHLYHGRGSVFLLNTHSGYISAFSAWNTSARTAIHGLRECLSTMMILHKPLLFIKEHISQQIKCGNGPILMSFTGLTMLPTILMKVEIYIFFWLMLAWFIFLHFNFNWCMNLYLNWVSSGQHIVGSWFLIHSDNLFFNWC